jgi:Flp pilus assembly protein TadD
MRKLPRWTRSPLAIAAIVWTAFLLVLATQRTVRTGPVVFTTGDIRAMHAEVRIGNREVRGSARLADGDTVKTGPDGRARVRLDDGTLVVVGGSTELALRDGRLVLARGRLFVQGGAESRAQVALGDATTTVSAAAAAFDAGTGAAPGKVYCARGELVVAQGGKQEHVAAGETASLVAGGPHVAPETAFDDWTGGLAVPWGGEAGQASAIPGLWAGAGGEDPGTELSVRTARVDVDIDGEVAVTHVRTTYFNGSDRAAPAEVRLALPPGAVVSRVARALPGQPDDDAAVRAGAMTPQPTPERLAGGAARLEWAGGGWLRGELPAVPSGATEDLIVDYVEWLPERDGRAAYRFPMASDARPPMVGELLARIRSIQAGAPFASASAGATVDGNTVELRRGDVRPTGDLVVETVPTVVHPGRARAYVALGSKDEDPYVLVRTEVPPEADPGITLALVVDTSFSAGAAALETERAVVDALLEGLGPRDSLVVLAADQTVRSVGGNAPAPVTPELRDAVRKGLASMHAGGASNVAAALEQAADVLDAGGMVVYLGDGRASIGESTAQAIRRRLARREGGVPRMGAVAIGHGSDRWLLAQLVAGSGPMYEAVDRADAARVGAAIVADALEPTLRDVDIDLGPTVDRVYPRESRAALAGSTVTVAGRLRGKLPDHVGFRWRRGGQLVQESRPLEQVAVPAGGDVARRWALARIEELSARDEGIEPAVALAAQAALLTPWTGWFFGGGSSSSPFEQRLLALSPTLDAPYAARVEPEPPPPALLLEPPNDFSGDESVEDAAVEAARRAIEETVAHLQACRDARAAVRPDVSDALHFELSVNAGGLATDVRVTAAAGREDDPVLDRCAKGVVAAVSFFASGQRIQVTWDVHLPPARTPRRTQCSVASELPLPVRRGLWRSRMHAHWGVVAQRAQGYVAAAQACELPTWTDRRVLLEILAGGLATGDALGLAAALDGLGENDAAAFVRQELLRHVTTAGELAAITQAIVGREPKIDAALDKAYRAARSDDDRLVVVRRFLLLAPHDALALRRLLSVLEALGRTDSLANEIDRVRTDPFADAGLLAMGASALRRIGHDEEGRRAFGELVERAPGDPWALAFVGDRLRAERLWDDAVAVYERLDTMTPDDPAVALRLALAHAGAGRLDVATRLLDRAASTGGRSDDGRIGELASVTEATLLATARQGAPGCRTPEGCGPEHQTDADVEALLGRRLSRTPLPDVGSLVMVRAAPGDDPLVVRVARDARGRDEDAADLDAQPMGLAAIRVERGGGPMRIALRRPQAAGPGQPTRATVTALVLADDRSVAKLVSRDVTVSAGDGVVLQWNGDSLL